jgi:phosphatidylglycerophosphate synthase
MKKIPVLLIYSRVVLGVAILLLSCVQPCYFRAIIITFIAIGLLTDIFDGIIARRLGISSEKLRRLDSAIDQVFWILILVAACIIAPDFYKSQFSKLIVIIALEAFTYLLCFIRFRKEVATHAILSKIWTLTIFAAIIETIATGGSPWLFDLCYILGIITRLEIIFILLLLRQWTNDVPSIYHALLIRNGKKIKRNKWFNG